MSPYTLVTKNLSEATRVIKQGRVVAFPTGTSYGLAADVLQGFALRRLRNLKQRHEDKTFTVCLDPTLYPKYLDLAEPEQKLLNAMQSKPLTLLVKPQASLAHLAQEGRVGLRLIDHPVMAELATACQVPLTATSANISGQDACLDVQCILKQFPGRIDETTYDLSLGAIFDAGELPPAEPTTIAKLEDDKVTIIRPGSLTTEDIQKVLV